jgi:hypothetical protein
MTDARRLRFEASFTFILVAGLLVAGATLGCLLNNQKATDTSTVLLRKPIDIPIAQVRQPLPYRIVSFHRGQADKRLVKLAAQLGFNGVQIQIEGSTVDGLIAFKSYDAKEHFIDYCHALGMKVTIWVHELSDVPALYMPESLGPITPGNTALWSYLDTRYDWVLHDVIPNIDGLCLTVVETEIRVTDAPVMLKLVDCLRRACDRHGKSLQVRTFVWFPDEFKGVMDAVKQLPQDTVIMSKCVPQDWNLRGINGLELGDVGGRTQIEEFDVDGEYFLRDHVANCMPALLKRQFDYGIAHHISGICVRVDREDSSVLDEPNEVNLWTLGMLASGASNNLDDIWSAWATNRFGAAAAPGVIRALKPSGDVVAEMLSIGPFEFGDTRKFPPLGDEDIYGMLNQNYWWNAAYRPLHEQAEWGDPAFTQDVASAKSAAMREAEQCLQNLEDVKPLLSPQDYAILHTKLLTNKVQLEFRTPMVMAVLHYRRMISTWDDAEREQMDRAIQEDLKQLRTAALPIYPKPIEIKYLDKTWQVGPPEDVDREAIFRWAHDMDLLRQGQDPRHPYHRPRSIWH